MDILLIFLGFIVAFIIVLYYELKIRRTESMNKIHFYVARDKDGTLNLWFNKPKRAVNFWYCQQKQDGWKATEEFIQNKHEINCNVLQEKKQFLLSCSSLSKVQSNQLMVRYKPDLQLNIFQLHLIFPNV